MLPLGPQILNYINKTLNIEAFSKSLGHPSIKTIIDGYDTEELEVMQTNYERMVGEMF